MIYLDMDGVIADFFGALAEKFGVDHWKDIKTIESNLALLHNTSFFYDIKPFKETPDIIELVKKVCTFPTDWGICSSPLRGDEYNSAYWKRNWLSHYDYLPEDLEHLIFTNEKHKYAVCRMTGKPNVLIDDKLSNIINWENAGGIGIRFQTNEDDVEYLEEQLWIEAGLAHFS